MLGRRFVPSEELAYERLKAKGFVPASIIDVGAYEGNWTRLVRRVFPGVPVLMVEPQSAKRAVLEQTSRELPGVRYVEALLGRRSGTRVHFFEMETGSSMFSENSNAPRTEREIATQTLDEVAGSLLSPTFLKIDVQGAELEVLEGAHRTLAACEVVQLEVALVPYNEGAPNFLEVLTYMASHDFAPFDVSGLTRPNGVDLAQMDLLFARTGSNLRRKFFEF